MITEVIASAFLLVGSIYALSAKHLMRGVVGLTFFFVGLAVFFASFEAWYLAVGQLFLFVGGVATLFVLAFNFSKTPVQTSGKIAGLLVFVVLLGCLGLMVPNITSQSASLDVTQFASIFFSQYGWVLNVALLVLFAALIGSQYLLEVEE